MPVTKQQEKSVAKKGLRGPVQKKVNASKKQIVAFFDSHGVICTNNAPEEATGNGVDIRTELCRFLKVSSKRNRPWPPTTCIHLRKRSDPHHRQCAELSVGDEHKDYLVATLLYFPVMVSVDHFLFPRVKAEIAAISLMQQTFQKTWDGVLRTIAG
jgi:hypothetical protein